METTLVGATEKMVMGGRSNCVAGAKVVLYKYGSTYPEQRWEIRKNSFDSYCLSPKKNLSLNLSVEGTVSNAKVKLASKADNVKSQQWYIESVSTATNVSSFDQYYVRNVNSGQYLDLQGSNTADGTHIQQYPFISTPSSERYDVFIQNDGYLGFMTPLHTTAKVMDGRSNCVAGAQVALFELDLDCPEQFWFLHKNSNGTFSISPQKNVYLNLAVEGGSTASNAKVKLAARDFDSPSQQWVLEPVEPRSYMWSYVFSDIYTYRKIYSGYRLPGRFDHYAIDIISNDASKPIQGKPILAPWNGEVFYRSDDETTAGNYVVLEFDCFWPGTGKKLRMGFMHMRSPTIYPVGYKVKTGDILGFVGNTGNADGYHLDLSVFTDGIWPSEKYAINPQRFFPYVDFTGDLSTVP